MTLDDLWPTFIYLSFCMEDRADVVSFILPKFQTSLTTTWAPKMLLAAVIKIWYRIFEDNGWNFIVLGGSTVTSLYFIRFRGENYYQKRSSCILSMILYVGNWYAVCTCLYIAVSVSWYAYDACRLAASEIHPYRANYNQRNSETAK